MPHSLFRPGLLNTNLFSLAAALAMTYISAGIARTIEAQQIQDPTPRIGQTQAGKTQADAERARLLDVLVYTTLTVKFENTPMRLLITAPDFMHRQIGGYPKQIPAREPRPRPRPRPRRRRACRRQARQFNRRKPASGKIVPGRGPGHP